MVYRSYQCNIFLSSPYVILVAAKHTFHQIAQRAPEVLPAGQFVLVHEEHVMLEASVKMWFEAQIYNHWVMVTVDMGVYSVKALEQLAQETSEGFGERDA